MIFVFFISGKKKVKAMASSLPLRAVMPMSGRGALGGGGGVAESSNVTNNEHVLEDN